MKDAAEAMFVNQDPQYVDDDDDIGTSPINLPDPSLFSDFHENDMGDSGVDSQGEQRVAHGQD